MEYLVEVSNLQKSYGKKQVLKNVNFHIAPGQIVGLLGPNGSGKTTLIKSMNGLIQDYNGVIRIDNNMPGVYTKKVTSYLPENTYLSKWMDVRDGISLFEDFYTDFDRKKAEEMVKCLGLDLKLKIRTMSKGMQEKMQLILVMSRNAKLYILDEPIGGVDPAARDYILDTIIKNFNNESSILLSTHLIHDVERIFDRAMFLKDGEMVINEDVDKLREMHSMSIDDLFREVYRA